MSKYCITYIKGTNHIWVYTRKPEVADKVLQRCLMFRQLAECYFGGTLVGMVYPSDSISSGLRYYFEDQKKDSTILEDQK